MKYFGEQRQGCLISTQDDCVARPSVMLRRSADGFASWRCEVDERSGTDAHAGTDLFFPFIP